MRRPPPSAAGKVLIKVLESTSTQTRLESYLMRYEKNVTFGKMKSKRLQDALKDVQGKSDSTKDAKEGDTDNHDSKFHLLYKVVCVLPSRLNQLKGPVSQ